MASRSVYNSATDFIMGTCIILSGYHIIFIGLYHNLSALYYVDIGACITTGYIFHGHYHIHRRVYYTGIYLFGQSYLLSVILFYLSTLFILSEVSYGIYFGLSIIQFYLSIFYLANGNILEAILYLWAYGIFIRIWDHILIFIGFTK